MLFVYIMAALISITLITILFRRDKDIKYFEKDTGADEADVTVD